MEELVVFGVEHVESVVPIPLSFLTLPRNGLRPRRNSLRVKAEGGSERHIARARPRQHSEELPSARFVEVLAVELVVVQVVFGGTDGEALVPPVHIGIGCWRLRGKEVWRRSNQALTTPPTVPKRT